MIPIEFDHTLLDGLPLPGEEVQRRVVGVLKAIVGRRVMPHFRKIHGTDATVTARISDNLSIRRLEDEKNRVRTVGVLFRREGQWVLSIHERIFDYLAFIMPTDAESRLGGSTPAEANILAFAEFMLRHQIEHMIYPMKTGFELVESDVAFAMKQRGDDPTFYKALLSFLGDPMNGIRGEPFLTLFAEAEQGNVDEALIGNIVQGFAAAAAEFPLELISAVFEELDTAVKVAVLGAFSHQIRSDATSLLQRTSHLHKLLALLASLATLEESEGRAVLDAFGVQYGFSDLSPYLGEGIAGIEDKSLAEAEGLFKGALEKFTEESAEIFPSLASAGQPPSPVPRAAEPKVKSLKVRIEELQDDETFPLEVKDLVNKNKLNIAGVSGYKYSELIETLLAIPWGKIQPIQVSPQEFEIGLNRTHYGLDKPKEILCDFFTNLIWRYRNTDEKRGTASGHYGSSFLFVGPPGVGKTSLAISVAENLRIPYHKLSLGGMRDEADLRGHGFTYEGSKPGAIVQGLIKMGIMNGMFIMDEADKTEKFAIATLLEILDPEQNHLFHDKYTQTTVDIDLSKCHFILTANTLETVPAAVINRCEVVILDRYSIEEKVAIARQHLIGRVRRLHDITEDQIALEPGKENELLRYLVKRYTREAGVRELERIIRSLFLRIFRKDILTGHASVVTIDREVVKNYLEEPNPPRMINPDDRIGEMIGLGINPELGVGSIIPIQATQIKVGADEQRKGHLSVLQATGNIEKIMDESRTVATTAMLYCGTSLGIPLDQARPPIHLHFMGGSTPKDGPSAGGAIALALTSVLTGRHLRRDVAMTGEIDTQGRITGIGGLDVKLETASDAGCKTVIIPRENLFGEAGIERLSDALKQELHILTYDEWNGPHDPFDYERHVLQVIAVDNLVQAADIAFMDEKEMEQLENPFLGHAFKVASGLHATCEEPSPCFRILYIKRPEELEMENLSDLAWKSCGTVLLIKPDLRKLVFDRFPDIEEHTRLWDFDPPRQNLAEILESIDRDSGDDFRASKRLSILAPHFFLVSQKPFLESFYGVPAPGQLTLFANNYTVQGVKVKESKAILNNVYRYLSQLDREQLDKCPFLGMRDGIYVIDLSYIPEKYRLDIGRAQALLNRGLRNWLAIVEKAVQASDEEPGPPEGSSPPHGRTQSDPSKAYASRKTRR